MFERKIARDLRKIYDPPELNEQIEKADNKIIKKILGKSCVRRGEQGKNAHEPDIVAPCDWWLELEDGGSKGPDNKLNQALRDLKEHSQSHISGRWRRAVAICHAKGSTKTTATMTLEHFIESFSLISIIKPFDRFESIRRHRVTINYEAFLELLTIEKKAREEQGTCKTTYQKI